VPRSWTREEVEATVADYFDMLSAELRNEPYSKAEHRRRLLPLLNGRSEAAVERKRGNISAVLLDLELGYPPIQGYKPYSNYQNLLVEVVLDRLRGAESLESAIRACNDEEIIVPEPTDLLSTMVEPPDPVPPRARVAERPPRPRPPRSAADYLDLERRNARLGRAGEEFVVAFERARLIHDGQARLADSVEHVARTRGDGEGFDILSFEISGRERLIEVKTTKHGPYTPFFVTQNEVRVSEEQAEQYHLYRVFSFRKDPRLFALPGAIPAQFQLRPTEYLARRA